MQDKDGKDRKEKCEFTTEKFSGPIELLLFLIQENKVDIYDIPIAEITEQFLAYIQQHSAEIEEISDFYHFAADLLYIKSKMLLPYDVEFDEEYEDPRQELVERLLEYQKYKKYTDLLTGKAAPDRFYIPRKENPFLLPYEDEELFKDVTLENLLMTYRTLLEKVVPAKVFNIYEEVSVNEKIAYMNELLEDNDMILITDIIVHMDRADHIICSFMAILEATKWKMILLRQEEPYGQIYITKRPPDWDPEMVDEYDRQHDKLIDGKAVEDEIVPDDSGFIDDSDDEDSEAEVEEFIGDEEEIDLEDDDE